jgi:hypothetical protein
MARNLQRYLAGLLDARGLGGGGPAAVVRLP